MLMPNITFKDYENAIKAKYEIEKEGDYSKYFNPTAQANLRDLCWERFIENESKDDLNIFLSFFEFNFDLTNVKELRNKLRKETDKFKPIVSFYLKEEKKTANRYAIELASILVDFQPRPFKKFKDVGIIVKEDPIGAPKIPFAFNIKNECENETFEKEEIKEEIKEEEKENDSNKEESVFKDDLIASNNSNYFQKILNRFSKIFTRKFSERLLKTMIITLLIFTLVGTAVHYAFFQKNCMQWTGDHYEIVDCNLKTEGLIMTNPVELLDESLVDLKKIKVCDTTVYFDKNENAIIWYAKRGDSVDFFNGHGRHPLNNSPLRPVTKYILDKYVNNKEQK